VLRPSNELTPVYLCREPVDFRKGLHALAVLVESELKLDPFASGLFVFRNRRGTGIKLLYWERNGFCLWHKKLEQERFYFPKAAAEAVITITGRELNWLLDGYDITRRMPHKTLCYSSLL
jgi:transposase